MGVYIPHYIMLVSILFSIIPINKSRSKGGWAEGVLSLVFHSVGVSVKREPQDRP